MSRTMRRLAQRLVVVGASTAVIAGAALPLTTGVANAAAGDNATAVTLSPHGAKDTIGACTPYKATVAPNAGVFDVQLSGTAEANGYGLVGFCDISGYSATTFPHQTDPSTLTPVPAGGVNSYSDSTDSDINGNTVYGCADENDNGGLLGVTTTDHFTCSAQFTAVGGVVSFGVFDDQYNDVTTGFRSTLTSVSMGIQAYDDVNVNDVYESGIDTNLDSTSETWYANQASSMSCAPASQNADAGGAGTWGCTPMTAGGTPYDGGTTGWGVDSGILRYVVASGPDKTAASTCALAPVQDASGNDTVTASGGESTSWGCSVTNGGIAGTDAVTTYADNNDNNTLDSGEPSSSVNITFVLAAPSTAVINVACSPNVADNVPAKTVNSGYDTDSQLANCEEPTSHPTSTWTATVVQSAVNPVPVAGALVTWNFDYGQPNSASAYSFSPANCITGSNGSCSTTVTALNPAADLYGSGSNAPDYIEGYASVALAGGGSYSNDDLFTQWHNAYPGEARNVTVAPATGTATSGGSQTLVATVTDRFGGPVAFACVGWNTTGSGHITNAPSLLGNQYCTPAPTGSSDSAQQVQTYDYECMTNTSGQCSVQLITGSAEAGTESVTADIANYTNVAGYDDNGLQLQECSETANTTLGDGYDNATGNAFDSGGGSDRDNSMGSVSTIGETGVLAATDPYNGVHIPWYLQDGAGDNYTSTDGGFSIPNVAAGNCTASSTVTWQLPGTTNAATISLAPSSTTLHTHSDGVFTATVRDGSGAAVPGATVTFIASGPGSFGGSSSTTAVTDANGRASAVLTTGSGRGTGSVTASISSSTTGCSGASCLATSSYRVKQVMSASLHCTSPRAHVVKCVATVSPRISGLAVVFRVRSHGHWVKWGTRHTNSNGKAKLVKKHLKAGKTYRVKAHVRSTGTTTGANTNRSSATA